MAGYGYGAGYGPSIPSDPEEDPSNLSPVDRNNALYGLAKTLDFPIEKFQTQLPWAGTGKPAQPKPTGSPSAIQDNSGVIKESHPDVNSIFAHGDYGSSPMRPRDLTAATMTAANEPAPDQGAAKIRAIKMPNGRIQFTNVGAESTPEGDKPKQGTWTDYGQAASKFRNEQYREPDSPTDSALVRASHRAVSNNPGSIEAGGVSFMPGTDEQQRELALEKEAGLAAMAKAQFERSAYGAREHVMQQEANLTPRERAEMASKNLMETEYMTNWATSEHKMNERSRIADEAAISSSFPPGSPEFHDAMERISKRYRANELRILQHSRRAPLSSAEQGLWEDLETNPAAPATR